MDRPEQDVKDIVCGGKVEAYVNRALWLSYHSNRSDYAVKYRKYYELHVEKQFEDNKQDVAFCCVYTVNLILTTKN